MLCAAVQLAGLAGALSEGTWTVFAPTDDAFIELLGMDAQTLVASLDATTVADLLFYHVIADNVILSTDVECDTSLTMASGGQVET